MTAIAIVSFGAVAYLLAAVPQSPLHAVARSAGAAPAFYSYLVLLLGLVVLHAEFDGVADRLLLGVVTLATAIAGIALSGKENGAVRYLGYAAFAVETLYLASETIGSIEQTSGGTINVGTCFGDFQTEFVDYSQGYNNTWRTDFNYGVWRMEVLEYPGIGVGGENTQFVSFGHLCKQTLLSSTKS